jgi:hypothetical protein
MFARIILDIPKILEYSATLCIRFSITFIGLRKVGRVFYKYFNFDDNAHFCPPHYGVIRHGITFSHNITFSQ